MEETTSGELALALVSTVESKMAEFEASSAPRLRLPAVYAGHPVLDDTNADLLYVMGLLVAGGTVEVAGVDLRERSFELLGALDPDRVEAFGSYRVGETVQRLGGLGELSAQVADRVLRAVESPGVLNRLEDLPPNYAVVATRVLTVLAALRGDEPPPEIDTFMERIHAMFANSRGGWIDDGMGDCTQYDIYTPDMYLFAEPLADALGPVWEDGLSEVLRDLDGLALPGGAVTWGRSVGALGLAMTIELAALVTSREIGTDHGRWLRRASQAHDDLVAWFPEGVIAAHQRRSPMFYRGPARRLQMTLDIYGKLLLAASDLGRAADVDVSHGEAAWASVDKLYVIDETANAAVWSFRSPPLNFTLPLMFGFSSDYLPSPSGPGLFETPTSGHPTMLPVVHRLDLDAAPALVPSGLPTLIDHEPHKLRVEHQGWAPVAQSADGDGAIGGSRTATYEVTGRTLTVRERLRFDQPPGPISITVAEATGRPLDVTAAGGAGPVLTAATDGIAEWRSFWGELPRVHQIQVDPAVEVDLSWTVTPRLRVASTIAGHPYDDALYQPLRDRLVTSSVGSPDTSLSRRLRDIDVVHMAWPEWWAGTSPDTNREVIETIHASGTAIVWTQHNLLPHFFKDNDAAETYGLWAKAARAVIHHSESGRDVALATYDYGAQTEHHVIPHGHWGHRYTQNRSLTRAQVELEEGWAGCGLRLAVVGAPRAEKRLQQVVDAVAASTRDDLQLVIRVDASVDVPDDRRIFAEYGQLDNDRFHRRLVAYDALILPFEPTGMLTTGTAFDCIGAGVPAITSNWSFFDQTFRGADIRYGEATVELTRCIDALTPDRVTAAAEATVALQSNHEWVDIARQTLDVLEGAAESVRL